MRFNNEKAKDIIYRRMINEKELITVKSGECRYNYRCHKNAVHEALKNKESRIALVLYVDDECWPVIHFINVDKKGRFIDNTLGKWSEICNYYLVRYIEEDDFFQVDNILGDYRDYLRSTLPWWIRVTSDVEN